MGRHMSLSYLLGLSQVKYAGFALDRIQVNLNHLSAILSTILLILCLLFIGNRKAQGSGSAITIF